MLFDGVVSAQTEVVEFFLQPEAAEAMIGELREDDRVLAEGAAGRGNRTVKPLDSRLRYTKTGWFCGRRGV
jgi:hypothetical protein